MIFTLIKQSLHQLHRNKGRTTLTIVGITIGIAVVILVLSAGNGVKGLILGQVNSFGNDWIQVEVKLPNTDKASRENSQSQARGVTITTFTYEDAQALGRLSNIKNFYSLVTTQVVVSYGNQKKQPTVFAVSPQFIEVDRGSELARGRFFTTEENESLAQTLVLGSSISETLFGNDDPIGKSVNVGSRSFRIVGVMKARGSSGFFNWDDVVYMPLKTAQKKVMGIDHILSTIAQVKDTNKSDATVAEMKEVLRERHNITNPDKDDFAVTTQQESIDLINTVFFGIQTLLVVLAAISLVVGGVGIMNVMYVSVVERTFEIGLRKAVGATEKTIERQFLTEAVVLTFAGGILGITIGIALSGLIALVAQALGFDWAFIVSLPSIFLGTFFSVGVGLVFGYFPAKKAALLDPIEALRQE